MSWILLIVACSTTNYVPSDDDLDDASDSDVISTETDTDGDGVTDESDPPTETDSEEPTDSDSDDVTDEETETDTEVPGSEHPIISEVCDHADYGNVKYVELYNAGANAIALSNYVIERYSNGGSTASGIELSGTLYPGDTFVIANTSGSDDFESLYGRAADVYDGNINGNGDDVYLLSLYGAKTIDIFGQVGVDGSGTDWEYTDSIATRRSTVNEPSSTWVASEWLINAGSSSASPFDRE